MVKDGAPGPARGATIRFAGPVLRALLRQRRRLVLAGFAIALGVGYLAGALGLLDRIGAGLDQLATASADSASVVVEGGVAYESQLEQVRRLVPSSIADSAARIDGVKSASHRLEDVAVLVDAKGKPVVAPGLSEQPLGVNWPEDRSISTYSFLSGGPPTGDGEVAIDGNSAQAAGVGVGDSITVAGKGKVGRYKVSGVIDPAAGRMPKGSSLVVLTTPEARLVFDRPIDDNRVSIVLDKGADPAKVTAELQTIVPPGTEVVDGATAARHQQEGLTRSFALIRALVTGFGVLALLVGMLTVANSLSLLHSERRQLFATFRLVGAKVPQLRRAALTEAVLLALVASVVAIPLGVVLAVLIERALGTLGTAVPTAGPVLSLRAVLWAVGLGVTATLVAAWRPVSRACSVTPIEAIQPTESGGGRTGWFSLAVTLSWAAVVGVAAAGVALLANQAALTVAGIGVATAVVILVVGALPWMLSRAVAGTMSILPFRPPPLRRIAARDAARNPRRTAATAAAVLLAAAVVSGLAIFLHSFTASVDSAVDGLVTADLVVDSGTFTRGGLPADLVERLRTVDGVDAVSGWQLGRGSVGEVGVRMTGVDGASATEVMDPKWRGSPPERLDDTTAWISGSMADRTGLSVGDTLPLTFTSGGVETLRITGVYTGGSALLGDVVTDRKVLIRQVPATVDLAAIVDTDGSASTEAAVSELAASYGVTSVLSPQEFVDSRSDLLRGFQRVIEWMLLFTLVQALVGVVNTLMLSVGERRREFGLLRVSGASRSQVLRMVMFEGSALALVGTLVGVAVGVFGAWLGVQALASLGLGVFAIPVPTVLGVTLAAVTVGVAAAVIPARMAAKVPPLEAVLDSGVEFLGERARKGTGATPPVPAPVPVGAPAAPTPAWGPPPVAVPVVAPAAPTPASAPPPVAVPVVAPAAPTPAWAPPPVAVPVVAPAAPVFAPVGPAAPAAFAPPVSTPAGVAPPPFVEPALVEAALGDEVLATAILSVFTPDVPSAGEPAEAAALRALYADEGEKSAAPLPGPVVAAPPAPEPEPEPVSQPVVATEPVPAPEPEPVPQPVVAAEPVPAPEPEPVSQPVSQPVPQPVVAAEPVPVPAPEPAAPFDLPPVVAAPVAFGLDAAAARRRDAEPFGSQPEAQGAEPANPATRASATAGTAGDQGHVMDVSADDVVETEVAPPPASAAAEPFGVGAVPGSGPPGGPESGIQGGPGTGAPDGPGTGQPGGSPESPEAAATRREKLRRRSAVRLPRRRTRRDGVAPAAEGWVGAEQPEPVADGPGATAVPAPDDLAVAAAAALTDESLARAVRRLDSRSVLQAADPLTRVGTVLAPGEVVKGLVCGRVRGWPTAMARTDRRILLVIDRDGRPMVESLHPMATGVMVRRVPDTEVVSLAVFDRGRVLDITDVVDAELAEALVRRDALSA